MEQQLIENIIEILPTTMDDLLNKIQTLMSTNAIEDPAVLSNIIKSLFYGLWNFDKMINQHNLNTKISELLVKIPKKNALLFFESFLEYLHAKWNLIDHHRINKFMQLVRYLLGQAFKLADKLKSGKKRIDEILMEKVYRHTHQRSGLTYHVTDIYFEVCQQYYSRGISIEELKIFQELISTHPNENLRLYVVEHIYEKYKQKLANKYNQNQEQLLKLNEDLLTFSRYFLQLAKKQQKQHNRKNLYLLAGFAKSPQFSFSLYQIEKKAKQQKQEESKKKKMSKFKKEEIKKLKAKRKMKKGKKITKIMSVRKFEDKNRMKKGIEEC